MRAGEGREYCRPPDLANFTAALPPVCRVPPCAGIDLDLSQCVHASGLVLKRRHSSGKVRQWSGKTRSRMAIGAGSRTGEAAGAGSCSWRGAVISGATATGMKPRCRIGTVNPGRKRGHDPRYLVSHSALDRNEYRFVSMTSQVRIGAETTPLLRKSSALGWKARIRCGGLACPSQPPRVRPIFQSKAAFFRSNGGLNGKTGRL